jgi:twitching motility protein PilU
VLLNTPYIADLIQKGKIDYVKDAMEQSTESGTQTFDQALFKLYKEGKISKDEAIKNADSKNNVALQIRLSEGMESGGGKSSANSADLTLHMDDDSRRSQFGI